MRIKVKWTDTWFITMCYGNVTLIYYTLLVIFSDIRTKHTLEHSPLEKTFWMIPYSSCILIIDEATSCKQEKSWSRYKSYNTGYHQDYQRCKQMADWVLFYILRIQKDIGSLLDVRMWFCGPWDHGGNESKGSVIQLSTSCHMESERFLFLAPPANQVVSYPHNGPLNWGFEHILAYPCCPYSIFYHCVPKNVCKHR